MSNYYTITTIQQYFAGELDPAEMHQLELDALKDPMLQDALEGFESSKPINQKGLSLLQQRLETRIEVQYEKRNHFYFGRQRLAVASVAGVLFIVVCILFWMVNFPSKKANSIAGMKEVSVNLQPLIKANLKNGNLEPTIGWKELNHYFRINNQEDLTGAQVEVSFKVINERPTSIEVIKSSGNKKAIAETIRLIKEGPNWKGKTGVVEIQF